MNKTMHLIEYAMQVRDAYQSQIDAKQNNTMQYLSVISTIFFPLTLITGWYGMNFKDMVSGIVERSKIRLRVKNKK